MNTGGNTALKVIPVVGVLALLMLWLMSVALKRNLKPNEAQRPSVARPQSPFDAQRAWNDLETIVGFGPRPAGSEAAEQTREYLRRHLRAAGLRVREQSFEAETPLGTREMVNLVGIVEGTRRGAIVLGNHYDTKHFEDFAFVGANDGGSTTAWMLEMARVLGARRDGRSIWLAWFDGEESFGKWSETDGLYGSRAFVAHLTETDELAHVAAMINVDMIGDCYLGVHRDRQAPAWLASIVWDTAERLGYDKHFLRQARTIEDDHLPFRRAGVPTLELIDFSYGGSLVEHGKLWHTAEDTLDHVCRESLQVVGDVLYYALPAVDVALDRQGSPRHGQ